MSGRRCLMIKTKDERRFFTHEENYLQLLEFSKAFKAEISVVRVHGDVILDLENLAPAICDTGHDLRVPHYEVIEVRLPQYRKTRPDILKKARKIKQFVEDRFLALEVVSLHGLRKKFARYNLSLSCLCNHIARVRRELIRRGFKVMKLGAGKYKVVGGARCEN